MKHPLECWQNYHSFLLSLFSPFLNPHSLVLPRSVISSSSRDRFSLYRKHQVKSQQNYPSSLHEPFTKSTFATSFHGLSSPLPQVIIFHCIVKHQLEWVPDYACVFLYLKQLSAACLILVPESTHCRQAHYSSFISSLSGAHFILHFKLHTILSLLQQVSYLHVHFTKVTLARSLHVHSSLL